MNAISGIMGEPTNNLPSCLMGYFSVPGKPVKVSEFKDFWESMSQEEKEYYRTVDLSLV
jgi:hypothetical protein